MKFQQWNMVSTPQTAVDELTSAGYSWLVSSVLASRGIASAEEAAAFLERDRSLSHSPFLMKDMDRAVERISRAIADDERIAVFGDYDVDGITATCILELLIACFVLCDQLRFRFYDGSDGAQLVAAVFHSFIFSAGHHSQHRTAHAGSLFGHRYFQLGVQHICKDPLPEGGFCAAAADLAAVDGNAKTSGHFHGVPDGKGNTFQHRLHQIRAGCIHGHTDEGTAGVGIVDGTAFAH